MPASPRLALRAVLSLAALVLLVSSPSALAQDTSTAKPRPIPLSTKTVAVTIFVSLPDGQPADSASVVDTLSGTSTRTDEHGAVRRYVLALDGFVHLGVQKLGYETFVDIVKIPPDSVIYVTLANVNRLAEVLTTAATSRYKANMLLFEEHRTHNAGGEFITPEQMAKEDQSDPLAYVLTSHGIHQNSRGKITMLGSCSTQVYVDGAKNGGNPQTASDIAAVEYYANGATAPAGFTGPCGVLLIWLRDPTAR